MNSEPVVDGKSAAEGVAAPAESRRNVRVGGCFGVNGLGRLARAAACSRSRNGYMVCELKLGVVCSSWVLPTNLFPGAVGALGSGSALMVARAIPKPSARCRTRRSGSLAGGPLRSRLRRSSLTTMSSAPE